MKLNNRRVCVGPRGGRHELSTPCAACVSFASCRPGASSEPWGCESWVDEAGRRPALDPPAWRRVEDIDRLDVEPEAPAPALVGVVGFDPEAGGPVLVAYVDPPAPFVPAELGQAQGVLPMPDAGPLFAAVDRKRGRS